MSKTIAVLALSMFVVGGMLYWLSNNDRRPSAVQQLPNPDAKDVGTANTEQPEITILCAASNQAVVEQIRKQYEAETGRKVSLEFGNSQSLLAQLEISKRGDLYLPADDSFLNIAKNKKLVESVN